MLFDFLKVSHTISSKQPMNIIQYSQPG